MRRQRISDNEASAVLRGQTPEARQDLGFLADSVTMFRAAVYGVPPRPSAEVVHRLDLERAESISASANGLRRASSATAADRTSTVLQPASKARRAKVLVSGFVGLGLAAKIALGATAAAAVGITGAGVAGAAGVLPPAAQHAFDEFTGNDIVQFAGDEEAASEVDTSDHPGRNTSENGVEKSRNGQETAEEAGVDGKQGTQAGENPGGVTPGISDEKSSTGEEAAKNADTQGPVRGDSGETKD